MAISGEKEPEKALYLLGNVIKPEQRVFIGVTNPISKEIETPESVCELLLTAAKYIPVEQLGSTDDCGFSPFADDISTALEVAYQKIKARLEGTKLAEMKLGLS